MSVDRFQGGVTAGTTGVSIKVILRQTSNSQELTGVAYSSVTAAYWRQGGAVIPIAMEPLSTPTSTFIEGGWAEGDSTYAKGAYRFDVKDAAFLAGADSVLVAITVPGCFVYYAEFSISANGPGAAILAPTGLDHMLTDVTSDANARASGFGLLRWLFNRFANNVSQTSTTQIVHNDAGTVVSTMAVSDDKTTAARGKSA